MRRTTAIHTAVATAAIAVLMVGCEPVADRTAGPGGSRPAVAPHHTTVRPHTPPRTHRPQKRRPAAKPTHRVAPPAPRPVIAPGTTSDRVRELQARLRALGLFGRNPTGFYGAVTSASVSSYQRGHGLRATGSVDSRTWASLRGATKQPSRGALYPPTTKPLGKPDKRCLTGRVLCISKRSLTLAWMVDGKVVSAMDVRFGSQYTPTREGLFKVDFKSRDHVSTIYHTPMPFAMFFSGGQAVHYSADFAARGYAGASHGCVNVRDRKKIEKVFAQVKAGDKVVVSH